MALSLPFAFYASETLDAWLRRRGARAIGFALAALAACVAASCSFDQLVHAHGQLQM